MKIWGIRLNVSSFLPILENSKLIAFGPSYVQKTGFELLLTQFNSVKKDFTDDNSVVFKNSGENFESDQSSLCLYICVFC